MKYKYNIIKLTLVFFCVLSLTNCEKPCDESKEINFDLTFTPKNTTIPFSRVTKVAALATVKNEFLYNSAVGAGTSDTLKIALNTSATKSTYIIEQQNGTVSRLTLTYQIVPKYETRRCGFTYTIENSAILASETTLNPDDIAIQFYSAGRVPNGFLPAIGVQSSYSVNLQL